ncbi:hypothetical protein [Janthinobacterium sp. HLX7-2]|uniref:hypothetical protein n=1 Tax=Janthinobacterium sp. HLX7-2 TaxID=1259331 RepID=UPI003F1E6183
MHEKTVDGVDLHVLVGRDVHGDFVVIDHATEYEKIELMVYSIFALGFIGFLICASLLGAFIANRLVAPIMALRRLSRRARRRCRCKIVPMNWGCWRVLLLHVRRS